jgi:hypothetical protein
MEFEERIFEDEIARQQYREEQVGEEARTARGESAPGTGGMGSTRQYMTSIGPNFKSPTPYQSTNAQCVALDTGLTRGNIDSRPMVTHLVQQLEGLQVSTNTDVELPEPLEADDDNIVSIRLDALEPSLATNASASVPIPLYQCLKKEQMETILYQYGLEQGIDDRDFVRVNFSKGTKRDGVQDALKENPMESFIAEIAGRLLGGSRMSKNWDLEQVYLQNIRYVIRIDPKRSSVGLQGTQRIFRGDEHSDQYVYGDLKSFDGSETTPSDEQNAVTLEHEMVCTTHRVTSPRLRSAISEAANLCEIDIEARDSINKYLNNREARTHLASLVSIFFRENENNIRAWRDPRGERERMRRKTFAAFRLRQMASSGMFSI